MSYEGYKAYLRNQRVLNPSNVAPHLNADKLPNQKSLGEGLSAPSGTAQGKVTPIEDYRSVMAQRAVFQGVASMGLPAFTIHSIVKYSGKAMKDMKNPRIRTWGPIGVSTGSRFCRSPRRCY